jgi:RNA polymerase sigma-70 factor (ECF subfamily)
MRMSGGQPSDAELIQRCREGEVEAFGLLVERYQDRVHNLVFRLLGHPEDALDAAQETFLRAYAALPRFELGQPFAPWLFRIATNYCFGVLRKRRPGVVSLDAMEEREADATLATVRGRNSGDPQEFVLEAVRDEEVQCAVLALPEPYRTVILLRYMEELSYEEIAAALEMPLGTVKTCLHRGRLRLRSSLAGSAGDSAQRHEDAKTPRNYRAADGEGPDDRV